MNILTLPDVQESVQCTQASELVRLFRLAEEKIKLVENLNHVLSIPAINELRYAGFHMAQFLAGGANAEGELNKAENHCKRAIYDAVEAGVTHQLEVIAQFQYDFRLLIISETVPGYLKIQEQANEARDLILETRDPKERAAYYEQCSVHLENLRKAQKKLDLHREDLLKALKRMNSLALNKWVGVGSLIACVVAAVFGALAYYKADKSDEVVAITQANSVVAPLTITPAQTLPTKAENTR
ncbi:hypothetical protein [Pseudomonas syringae group genomosp. 3]|uniref:Uncharacterized protein n=1 Tax=Pseudomonas syringae pv. viburni TaxID=251703 RepID=A0A0Q0ECM5_9PSED|nr:hypothetical protein [Pseudomonas syringae group genomosp. 3]KPZ19804.1 Uncharacterized protein ALO40_02222 [Pseudomonas syringae pv. viburni]